MRHAWIVLAIASSLLGTAVAVEALFLTVETEGCAENYIAISAAGCANGGLAGASGTGDSTGNVAASGTGNATGTNFRGPIRVPPVDITPQSGVGLSGTGQATGFVAVGGGGARADEARWEMYVNPQGLASRGRGEHGGVAISLQDADGGIAIAGGNATSTGHPVVASLYLVRVGATDTGVAISLLGSAEGGSAAIGQNARTTGETLYARYGVAINPTGDAAGGIAVSPTGRAEGEYLAVSGTGPAEGWLTFSITGDANGAGGASVTGRCSGRNCQEIDISGGDADAENLAVSTTGNARSDTYALSTHGHAEGYASTSVLGTADGDVIAVGNKGAYGFVAASGTGNAASDSMCVPVCTRGASLAPSGAAEGGLVSVGRQAWGAVSIGTNSAQGLVAAAPLGQAQGTFVAVAAYGAKGGLVGVSVFGPSSGSVAAVTVADFVPFV